MGSGRGTNQKRKVRDMKANIPFIVVALLMVMVMLAVPVVGQTPPPCIGDCPAAGSGAAAIPPLEAACEACTSCNPATTCNDEFEIELLGGAPSWDGSLATFTYQITKLTTAGPGLSHWVMGLGQIDCLGVGKTLNDFVVSATVNGSPITVTLGSDPTTKLFGVKFEPIPDFEHNQSITVTVTLDESALGDGYGIGTGCVLVATKAGNQDITRSDRASPGYTCVLGPVCQFEEEFEELKVSKTAVTSYTRTHEWDIDKSVDTEEGWELNGFPKAWLYIDGSGDETATWTVDVTYESYEDSDWNVSGVITIENTGTLDAVITDVDDVLAGTPITVTCGVTLPYTLTAGSALTCTYDEDGYVEGKNEVTVTTERDEYTAEADIVWGDPTTEVNKTVNIVDISMLFGEENLGSVTAPSGAVFTYTKAFAWEDYGAELCGSYTYTNTATIVETGQSADATLKVNVQCYVYDTAYAKGGSAECFIPTFRNWGWTNPITSGTYQWDLWAGAAQCNTSKGTLVGSVTVVYGANGDVTVNYNVAPPYSLEETHVYAGTTKFPQVQQGKRMVSTVAPGLYYNASLFNGGQVWVIAHAVVGLPDPSFGP